MEGPSSVVIEIRHNKNQRNKDENREVPDKSYEVGSLKNLIFSH